jgi:ubiquinone/menaquinone biosynthesis C-methylase UbiE
MADTDEFYTHGHHRVVVNAHATRSAADSAQFLLPYLRDDLRLLDFGCGPGSITADLARYVGSVVGVDSSPEAIAIARRDAAAPNVTYQEGSVYDLPFADDSFDVAYGHQILQHLADPVAALVEVRRVLRPGGLVAVRDSDFGSMTHHPHYTELDAWLDIYHQVARSNGGEPDAGRRLPEWVRAAGFQDVIATASSWHYTTPEQRLWWAQLWADRIRLPRFVDRAAALGLAAEIDQMAAAWLRWADEPDGWFAFVHGEVIATGPDTS